MAWHMSFFSVMIKLKQYSTSVGSSTVETLNARDLNSSTIIVIGSLSTSIIRLDSSWKILAALLNRQSSNYYSVQL
ncbi:hypothetical protein PGT21_014447 [Puccinia graminis f. sp. tritici]|uniref:Uncharacterized protein n=1 Tax=Puccinia graminis f. sp. tritici TaxID=56615 RepID=A0A5B0P0G5_PUCGR|nr:hypothetical protein PGT21_014447 [Puccinia graminis f. sp. tritici]KAA1093568.1 hypothetical protein PGTUg99_028344 [Puccinia graminis f. sp. tritici]